jgi:uncharacterized protein (TIGR02246 family)
MQLRYRAILTMLLMCASAAEALPTQTRACGNAAVDRFVDAWNRADATSLGGLFVGQGDLVIPTGEVFSGSVAITGFYQKAFDSGYAGSHAQAVIVRMRNLAPGVCLADGTWAIKDAHRVGAGQGDEYGVFNAVLVLTHGTWKISALREQTSAQKLTVF